MYNLYWISAEQKKAKLDYKYTILLPPLVQNKQDLRKVWLYENTQSGKWGVITPNPQRTSKGRYLYYFEDETDFMMFKLMFDGK